MERIHIQLHACWNWCKKLLDKRKIFFNKKLAQKYRLAYYECDKNGNIRISTLMNLLQDVTLKHTCKLGYGKEYLLRQMGWMVTRYAIKIKEYPKAGDKITVVTWVSELTKLTLNRQFLIINSKGKTLVEVVSKWSLVDLVKKKLLEIPPFSLRKKKLFTTSFAQPAPQKNDITRRFRVLFDNIDFNGHVNNSMYPFWACECIPNEFRLENLPRELTISFQKECVYGEEISVSTQIEELKTISDLTAADGSRHARVTIWWTKK